MMNNLNYIGSLCFATASMYIFVVVSNCRGLYF